MINWPLKLKYRRPGKILHRQWDPPEGTRVYSAGRFTAKKGGNSGAKTHVITVRPPMRAYWGNVAR